MKRKYVYIFGEEAQNFICDNNLEDKTVEEIEDALDSAGLSYTISECKFTDEENEIYKKALRDSAGCSDYMLVGQR